VGEPTTQAGDPNCYNYTAQQSIHLTPYRPTHTIDQQVSEGMERRLCAVWGENRRGSLLRHPPTVADLSAKVRVRVRVVCCVFVGVFTSYAFLHPCGA